MFWRLKTEKPKVSQGYVDTDYAGELDQRRSTMSYAFTIARCIVSWKTELQDTVVFSTI